MVKLYLETSLSKRETQFQNIQRSNAKRQDKRFLIKLDAGWSNNLLKWKYLIISFLTKVERYWFRIDYIIFGGSPPCEVQPEKILTYLFIIRLKLTITFWKRSPTRNDYEPKLFYFICSFKILLKWFKNNDFYFICQFFNFDSLPFELGFWLILLNEIGYWKLLKESK